MKGVERFSLRKDVRNNLLGGSFVLYWRFQVPSAGSGPEQEIQELIGH